MILLPPLRTNSNSENKGDLNLMRPTNNKRNEFLNFFPHLKKEEKKWSV